MIIANGDFVLCKPIPEKTGLDTVGSFFSDNRELIKLEVVFTSKYPNQEQFSNTMLYSGDFVYVVSGFSESLFNKAVYTFNLTEFIRVPNQEIVLVETVNKDASITNR